MVVEWYIYILFNHCKIFWPIFSYVLFPDSDNNSMAWIGKPSSVTRSNLFWGYSEYFHNQCSTSSSSRLIWNLLVHIYTINSDELVLTHWCNFLLIVLSSFFSDVSNCFCAVVLDILFSWRTRGTMRSSQKLRFVIKLSLAVTWAIILPIFYSSSQNYKACSARRPKNFLGMFCLSKYMVAVAFYLTGNVIGMALFFVPAVSSYIETSTWRICNILSWWCQVWSFTLLKSRTCFCLRFVVNIRNWSQWNTLLCYLIFQHLSQPKFPKNIFFLL